MARGGNSKRRLKSKAVSTSSASSKADNASEVEEEEIPARCTEEEATKVIADCLERELGAVLDKEEADFLAIAVYDAVSSMQVAQDAETGNVQLDSSQSSLDTEDRIMFETVGELAQCVGDVICEMYPPAHQAAIELSVSRESSSKGSNNSKKKNKNSSKTSRRDMRTPSNSDEETKGGGSGNDNEIHHAQLSFYLGLATDLIRSGVVAIREYHEHAHLSDEDSHDGDGTESPRPSNNNEHETIATVALEVGTVVWAQLHEGDDEIWHEATVQEVRRTDRDDGEEQVEAPLQHLPDVIDEVDEEEKRYVVAFTNQRFILVLPRSRLLVHEDAAAAALAEMEQAASAGSSGKPSDRHGKCPSCERDGIRLTFHHLVPRCVHARITKRMKAARRKRGSGSGVGTGGGGSNAQQQPSDESASVDEPDVGHGAAGGANTVSGRTVTINVLQEFDLDSEYRAAFSVKPLTLAQFLSCHGVHVCRACHDCVHRAENEWSLAKDWNTLDKLMMHPYVVYCAERIAKYKGKGSRVMRAS